MILIFFFLTFFGIYFAPSWWLMCFFLFIFLSLNVFMNKDGDAFIFPIKDAVFGSCLFILVVDESVVRWLSSFDLVWLLLFWLNRISIFFKFLCPIIRFFLLFFSKLCNLVYSLPGLASLEYSWVGVWVTELKSIGWFTPGFMVKPCSWFIETVNKKKVVEGIIGDKLTEVQC